MFKMKQHENTKANKKLILCMPWRHMMECRYSSLILNLSRRELVVIFTFWPLYPKGQSSIYLLKSKLGGAQSQFGHFVKKN